jgi:hypothetical protein
VSIPTITADSPAWAAFVGNMATDELRETIERLSAEANTLYGRLHGQPAGQVCDAVAAEPVPVELLQRAWQRRFDAIQLLRDELEMRQYMRRFVVVHQTSEEDQK